jgi:hypothetical protein
MLAVAGYLVQEAGIRLPGNVDYSGLKFADVPNGFAAMTTIYRAQELHSLLPSLVYWKFLS